MLQKWALAVVVKGSCIVGKYLGGPLWSKLSEDSQNCWACHLYYFIVYVTWGSER